MINPIANLFLALQAQIAGLVDGNGNTYFKYVDQDLGQMEAHNGDNRPPVLWPCVLIDIEDENYKNIGANAQNGVIIVNIRIGFPPFSASSAATPAAYIQKAIYYYDLQQILHSALQGTQPSFIVDGVNVLGDIAGYYDRISMQTEKRNDLIRVRQTKYRLSIDDYSTESTPTLVDAIDLNITTEITVPT